MMGVSKPRIRWPLFFTLEQADASFLETARHRFELSHDYAADPERLQQLFFFAGDVLWVLGLRGVDWRTPVNDLENAVIDELFAFMSIRAHVIVHERGRRSVVYISRWSMPFVKRMVQLIETHPQPDGRTRLRYLIAYEPRRVFEPFVPPVEWGFRQWLQRSLRNLEGHLRHEEAAPTSAGPTTSFAHI